jgi:UDP-N-acetylglucosamine:LPS N-acetylglucosamine transferase
MGVDPLGIDTVVNDTFLHEQPAVGHLSWIFAQKSRDVVAVALMSLELKLGLNERE